MSGLPLEAVSRQPAAARLFVANNRHLSPETEQRLREP
jgi:hypothetical protein